MEKLKLKTKNYGREFLTQNAKNSINNFSFFIFHFSFHQSKSAGFTLMEMVVSLGIFSSIMLMSIGALVSVQSAQIRTSDAQIVQDNIRFSLELMTKEIRQGSEYQGGLCGPLACAEFIFRHNDGVRLFGYCALNGALLRFNVTDGGSCAIGPNTAVITSEEVMVEGLLFYIRGQDPLPADGQARVTIAMRVRAQSPSQKVETVMDLQTTAVQRLREG
jgi:prepilin-type N-terminal cleavage/methylation domain-containing protein